MKLNNYSQSFKKILQINHKNERYHKNFETYQINVSVPSQTDLFYFYSSAGQIILNQEETIKIVEKVIEFDIFHIYHPYLKQKGPVPTNSIHKIILKKVNSRKFNEIKVNNLKRIRAENILRKNKEIKLEENKKLL
jgi:predicted SprT family Zn-dependent metalloprotease